MLNGFVFSWKGSQSFTGAVYCFAHVSVFSLSLLCQTVEKRESEKKEGRRESYRFNFFTVGLPGSVPLQQLFYRGLHSDALVHPRLICMKRTACHSCLLNTLFGADNSRHAHSPPYSTPPHLLPPPKSLSPRCVSFPENKNISYFPPIIYNLSMK